MSQTARQDRLADAMNGHRPWNDADWREEVDAGERTLERWLLVEESTITCHFAFATFPSAAEALAYSGEQEYAEDWDPVALVDLDTGDSRDLIRTYGATFA